MDPPQYPTGFHSVLQESFIASCRNPSKSYRNPQYPTGIHQYPTAILHGFGPRGKLTFSSFAECSVCRVDAGQTVLALADLARVRQTDRRAVPDIAVCATFTEEAFTGRHVCER